MQHLPYLRTIKGHLRAYGRPTDKRPKTAPNQFRHRSGLQKMRQMGLALEVRGLDLELLEQLQVAALPAPWGAGLLQLRPVLQQQLPPE